MSDACCSLQDHVLLFACSGASNVGQLANAAAVRLAQGGVGRMFCLAGVGAHIEAMVEKTRQVAFPVAIDGCGVHCARKVLEHAGITPRCHVVLTEGGIEKSHEVDLSAEAVSRAVAVVRAGLGMEGAGAEAACCSAPHQED